MKSLEELVEDVVADEAAITTQNEDTRTRVIRMGRALRAMQKLQKAEQAETGQTWAEWLADQKRSRGAFPLEQHCRRYMLIAKYPKAFTPGMSIKQAYKEAGAWKRNGGSPPLPLKTTIVARPLPTIAVAAARLHRKMDTLMDRKLTVQAKEQKWKQDELLGILDELTLLRQSCTVMIKGLQELVAETTSRA